MTTRRALLKAGVGVSLATAGGIGGEWALHEPSEQVLAIASPGDEHRAADLAAAIAPGHAVRALRDEGDREALLAAASEHLSLRGRTLVATASPAMHLLLDMAVRDTGARMVEDRHLAGHPLLIARS